MTRAVLFDFGDTLFRRAGEAQGIVEIGGSQDTPVEPTAAEAVWERIHIAAKSPEEIALGRGLSPEAHRREWPRLFSMADVLVPGMGRALDDREINLEKWIPYPDTVVSSASGLVEYPSPW